MRLFFLVQPSDSAEVKVSVIFFLKRLVCCSFFGFFRYCAKIGAKWQIQLIRHIFSASGKLV